MNKPEVHKNKCRIVVDAMGGDFAPRNAVLGAVNTYNDRNDFELLLVGRKNEIDNILTENNLKFNRENIIHAGEVITMSDTPTTALKTKPDSSIVIGTNLIKDKKADAFVSAGNTGAVMAASTLIIGRIPGVGRPTIGALMPNETGVTTVFDVGSSVDSKPKHLLEYAIMGSIFVKEIYGIEKPKVGLLSVGEEASKGNEVTLAAHNLLKESSLNFIGNIEGRDILKGTANVVVCDGFTGNILLKFGESVPGLLKFLFKDYAAKGFINKLKIGLLKSSVKEIFKNFDYQEYGGVPLLGINGITIIGHGSSTPKAFSNMIRRATEMYKADMVSKIEKSINKYSYIN